MAGGLNVYGFGAGDPINFSDPFGLCPGVAGTDPSDVSDCPSSIRPLIELGRNARATNQTVGIFATLGLSGGALGAAVRGAGAALMVRIGVRAGPAVPMLSGPHGGRDMLRQAVGHLQNMAASDRVGAFRNFAQQIEKATQGSWVAAEQQAVNATGFAGKAGEAIVFNAQGQAFRGNIGNAEQFTRTAQGLVANFEKLSQIVR